jgi:hypothetical protein
MQTLMPYIILAAGMYQVGLSFIVNTHKLFDAIVMRAIPGLIGVGLVIYGAKALGLI